MAYDHQTVIARMNMICYACLCHHGLGIVWLSSISQDMLVCGHVRQFMISYIVLSCSEVEAVEAVQVVADMFGGASRPTRPQNGAHGCIFFMYLFVYLCIYTSIYLLIYRTICPSINQSMYLSSRSFVCIFRCIYFD